MSIRFEGVNYIYGPGTAYETHALRDIDLEIEDGQFVGLIGHTGSGKSTLIQHMNGILRATIGTVYFNGEDIYADGYDMRALRGKVGLVFQYPEYQLFETTVIGDACFGPLNQGLDKKEAESRAMEALADVGIPEELFYASPFNLSGGQKRRAALAGVLAMRPDVLVLDEPTAGLDPRGREEILERIAAMHADRHMTVILASHSMEDVAKYAQRILVMDGGRVAFDDTPRNVFRHGDELEKIGLALPLAARLMRDLRKKGFPVGDAITLDEAKDGILGAMREMGWRAPEGSHA